MLDLFCGTGAITLEAISRGVKSATAIDIEFKCQRFLKQTARDWKIDSLRAVRADVFKVIKNARGQFDLIFTDPPYNIDRFEELPDLILNSGWLRENGLFILEHGPDRDFSGHERFTRHKDFGNVNFSFFR
jgi:16S rRNA (guanine(966)-N(2))-methyltransferase RsmD